MKKRILLGGFDIPRWGGAGTCQYQLLERMQADGFDVVSVSLILEAEDAFFRWAWGGQFLNPRSLGNVHACVLEDSQRRPQERLTALIESLAPDLLVSFGAHATVLMKLAAPHLPLVYMAVGSYQVQHLIETGAVRDFMDLERLAAQGVEIPVRWNSPERQAVQISDLVVVNSPLIRFVINHCFEESAGKVYANDIFLADLAYADAARCAAVGRPFGDRDIDLMFVASRWDRRVKNYPLVEKVASRSDGLTIHVVGDYERPHPACHHHGVVTAPEDLYALFGRTKTIACPSLVDAAPGVLFEASAMGCNVVASPNCGTWRFCNEELVARRCSVEDFLPKIHASLAAVYPDNRERFRGGYDDLTDVFSVF